MSLADRELLLVTGKGGVGKTTLTAALAEAARRSGRRVLVSELTSDVGTQSHLLGHFGHPNHRSDVPVGLGDRLDGVRITPSFGHRMFLRAALRVNVLADAAMRSAALNRFLMAAPAFPEIGSLFQMVSYLRSKKYDQVIVDLPATGHALGLARLPRTAARVIPSGLIRESINNGIEVMTDAARCGVVIATLPERLPVTEAFELARGLEEVDVPVGAYVMNRVPNNPFTDEERQVLDEHIRSRQGELLLGTREFRRIERALDAQSFFRNQATEVLSAEISEFEGAWTEVIEHCRIQLVKSGLADAEMS